MAIEESARGERCVPHARSLLVCPPLSLSSAAQARDGDDEADATANGFRKGGRLGGRCRHREGCAGSHARHFESRKVRASVFAREMKDRESSRTSMRTHTTRQCYLPCRLYYPSGWLLFSYASCGGNMVVSDQPPFFFEILKCLSVRRRGQFFSTICCFFLSETTRTAADFVFSSFCFLAASVCCVATAVPKDLSSWRAARSRLPHVRLLVVDSHVQK